MEKRNIVLERKEKIRQIRERCPYQFIEFVLNDLKIRGLNIERFKVVNFLNGQTWDEEILKSLENVASAYESILKAEQMKQVLQEMKRIEQKKFDEIYK